MARDDIGAKWQALGGPAEWIALGDAAPCGKGDGCSRHFVHATRGTLSTIHSHTGRGAFLIAGPIRDKWYELGAEHSVLGCPAGDERDCDDGRGRFTEFRRPGESQRAGSEVDALIICGPDGDPHEVHGPIAAKWRAAGFVQRIGYPVTDEFVCADGIGRYYQFQAARRSRIYATPQAGVHIVADPIYAVWLATGLEAGVLGYPVGDEQRRADLLVVPFQGGEISWSPRHGGAIALTG